MLEKVIEKLYIFLKRFRGQMEFQNMGDSDFRSADFGKLRCYLGTSSNEINEQGHSCKFLKHI